MAALIAGRREQRTTAGQHLREGLALPIENLTDRENRDFLVAAHALSLEQSGETRQAMLRLAGLIPRPANEMTLTHQWLPDLVRLALTVGERDIAQAAAEACQVEAAAGTRPAAASLRCYGLLESDPERLREAVAHYRAVGPAVELPAALEDLAVVLAERGHEEAARAALNEAVGRYEGMGLGGTPGGPRVGCARTALGGAFGAAARPAPLPAGRRSPPPRSRSPPWSPGATRRRTSPAACSCPGEPCKPTFPTS